MESMNMSRHKISYVMPLAATAIFTALIMSMASCGTSKRPDGTTKILVEYHKSTKSSTFLDSCLMTVALDDTEHDAIIKKISRLIFTGNRIIVIDRHGNKMVAFDKSGRFIASTSRNIGNGHNEYIRIADAAIDRSKGMVYAFCDAPYCVMLYDTDLKLKGKTPLDYYLTDIGMDEKYVYGIRHNDDTGTELIAIDKKDLSSKPLVLYTCNNTVAGLFGFGKSIIPVDGGILACLPFDNTIHLIKNGIIEESMTIDFGKHWASDLSKGYDYNQFLKKNDNKDWMIQNFAWSGSVMLFNTNMYHSYMVDIDNKACYAYSYLDNDITPFMTSEITPADGMPNCVAYELSTKSMAEYAKYAESRGPSKTSTHAYHIAKKYMDNGNPIIAICKIKQTY